MCTVPHLSVPHAALGASWWPVLPRASLAICRVLIQDSLMAGVNVLNTAVKNVGRPDLPGEESVTLPRGPRPVSPHMPSR